jgi:hypothetical protein
MSASLNAIDRLRELLPPGSLVYTAVSRRSLVNKTCTMHLYTIRERDISLHTPNEGTPNWRQEIVSVSYPVALALELPATQHPSGVRVPYNPQNNNGVVVVNRLSWLLYGGPSMLEPHSLESIDGPPPLSGRAIAALRAAHRAEDAIQEAQPC